jgi:hypothetical protein
LSVARRVSHGGLEGAITIPKQNTHAACRGSEAPTATRHYQIGLAVTVHIGDRYRRVIVGLAERKRLYRLKRSVAISQKNADRSLRASIVVASVRCDNIRLAIPIHVGSRNRIEF